ncbi:tyrosyl-DNA phosphodiesterase [Artemisia annua]|uniref:Tyrosyl-DNA phosphodiesterase n=1 Tax=Artemisia annua TaxID=35608 RepID=A0A2U1MPQ1_ARTAN|nr:tyrosyl-DNA phosphodiesterase [Artemisia annua]
MQTSSSQVGFLVPLNDALKEEEDNTRRIEIKKGVVNVIGRDDLPFSDKRLSRKHLSLTPLPHDHASVQLIVNERRNCFGMRFGPGSDFGSCAMGVELGRLKYPSAVNSFEHIINRAKDKKIDIFLDYEGTLSPTVDDPDHAFRAALLTDDLPFSDKRLSRKHLSLTPLPHDHASVQLIVEGTNPVVIRSKDQRKKLLSREKLTIRDGDIIELIPGHYLYKYKAFDGVTKRSSPNTQKRPLIDKVEDESIKQKRLRQVSEDESLARRLQTEMNGDIQDTESSVEAIRYFKPPKDKMSSTFRLMRVKGLQPWANTSSVSVGDVIQGNVLVAVLSNYMVDMDWLLSACPTLKNIPQVLVVHGESDGRLENMKRSKPANWILHKPPLPIAWGTHHSKAMFLVYPQGVRIIVHTANLIYVDWNNKSQGLWMQDFPWKKQDNLNTGSAFETDLVDYLSALKWPEFSVKLPELGNVSFNSSFFKRFDYSSATVRLIASVPGYHTGSNIKKWGHMKLRSVLQECVFDKEFQNSPLIYQFSSLGSLDEKWMTEFAFSMSSGVSDDKKPLGLGEPLIVWPTVEDIRCSLEGYAAGSCVPSPQKNVEKAFLKKYWAKWKASHSGRCRAMPHIKTFTRYNGQNLAWFLLTSSNLSKAAWGALQKNNTQLMIRSYELGVLFLPSSATQAHAFSCTENGSTSENKCGPSIKTPEAKRTKLVSLASIHSKRMDLPDVITLPVPYELPPQRYTSEGYVYSFLSLMYF